MFDRTKGNRVGDNFEADADRRTLIKELEEQARTNSTTSTDELAEWSRQRREKADSENTWGDVFMWIGRLLSGG
jgi:hypothetical protein